jgi:hypothetical protein
MMPKMHHFERNLCMVIEHNRNSFLRNFHSDILLQEHRSLPSMFGHEACYLQLVQAFLS